MSRGMIHILLTGSSRGIGAAIATALNRPDIKLVGHGTASGIPADFADPAAPTALWQAALERLDGRIDVLINNAGVFEANPLDRAHDATLGLVPVRRAAVVPAPTPAKRSFRDLLASAVGNVGYRPDEDSAALTLAAETEDTFTRSTPRTIEGRQADPPRRNGNPQMIDLEGQAKGLLARLGEPRA